MNARDILETLWNTADIREQIEAIEAAERLGGMDAVCEECEKHPDLLRIARATWVLHACVQDGDFIGRILGWERERAEDWAEFLWQGVGERDRAELLSEIRSVSAAIANEYSNIGEALVGADGARELAVWWRETAEILSSE